MPKPSGGWARLSERPGAVCRVSKHAARQSRNRRSADILVRQAMWKELADKNVRAPALLCIVRSPRASWAIAVQGGKGATELREAFGMRPACWRCRKAGASSTHSKRFAWQFIHNHARSLQSTSTVAVPVRLTPSGALGETRPTFPRAYDLGNTPVRRLCF